MGKSDRFGHRTVLFIGLASLMLMLTRPVNLQAKSITVDGTGRNEGPLPWVMAGLWNTNGDDGYPLQSVLPDGFRVVASLYDTGATSVVINQFSQPFLGLPDITPLDPVLVRANGFSAIDPDTFVGPWGVSPLNEGGSVPAQAEVGPIVVAPRPVDSTLVPAEVKTTGETGFIAFTPNLLGAPFTNQTLALIDYTSESSVNFDPFVDNIIARPTGPDITLFIPDDPGIPTPEILLTLERFGATEPSGIDGATRAQRYLLRNVAFENAGLSVDDDQGIPAPFNFFYDTGTTTTLINNRFAAALGINLAIPGDFSCFGGSNNGYTIDSIVMTGMGGTYTIMNPSLCVDPGIVPFAGGLPVDAIIGSNLFDQVPILFNGPGNTLGILSPDQPPVAELINDSLNLVNLDTAFDPDDSRAPAGVFTIEATFSNVSSSSFSNIFFQVAELTGGNTVLNATNGGGVGSQVSVSGTIDPGDAFDVVFEIGLQEAKPFQFFVDAFGTPNSFDNLLAILRIGNP